YKDINPICVYYKTGYIFNDRIIANTNEYAVISINDLFGLLEKFENKITSDIFRGYYKYISSLKDSYDKKESDYINNLHSHIGQFTLMSKLVPYFNDMVKSKADYENEIHPIIVDRMELGQNIGGAPWTQYTLLFKEDSKPVSERWVPFSDSYVDNIFCRIDRNKNGYYFSIRQYNHYNNDKDKIAVRLPLLRGLFAKAVKEVEDERSDRVPPLKLAHYFKNDNKGKFESKIADIYLDKLDKEDLRILIELLPIALGKFIDLIKL
ncbi:hypothetical protein, partial [Neobacillus drentensis]|uniref:hypothetical protein n=1 Tax=Neobacillus drentensis TaxID=220684 RepID=UPI002FFD9C17